MKEYNVQYKYLMKGELTIYAESADEAQETVASLVLSAKPGYLEDNPSDLHITHVDLIRDTVPEEQYKMEAI